MSRLETTVQTNLRLTRTARDGLMALADLDGNTLAREMERLIRDELVRRRLKKFRKLWSDE